MLAPWTWPLYWIAVCIVSSAAWTRFKNLTDPPTCLECGECIEESLARLGSLYCHDHRKPTGCMTFGGASGAGS